MEHVNFAVDLRQRPRSSAAFLKIHVKVKPNAKSSTFEPLESTDQWHAQLKSPPVDGKANAELVSLIADHFGCRKSAVSIKSGASGRMKVVEIIDL